jgi:hypothetical protein
MDDVFKIDAQHAGRPLSEQEQDAALNAVKDSPHVCLQFLPNHSLDENGELRGFVFSCPATESSQRLPINRLCSYMTTIYECRARGENNTFNTDAIFLTQNLQLYQSKLQCLADELAAENPRAGFHCITQYDDVLGEDAELVDQNYWEPSLPTRMGIYHAFCRCHGQDTRQHKMFVVISGCEWQAAEEFHALWQDFSEQYTAKEFCESEELLWLRLCTLRGQQRVAARIAELCDLSMSLSTDMHCPQMSTIATPIIQTYQHDLMHDPELDRVMLTNNASFVSKGINGILFDMFSSEGLWLFCGPADNASYNPYGDIMRHVPGVVAFPTSTVKFHAQYPPDRKYYCVHQALQDVQDSNGNSDADYNAETALLCKQMLDALFNENRENEIQDETAQQTNESNESEDIVNNIESVSMLPPKNVSTTHKDVNVLGYQGIIYSDIQQHRGTYLFPDEHFMQRMQALGFDRNDGIVILMPLCVYMHNASTI